MNNKGITLVALVVTIIVLLILAGVTISAVFGNRSIIEKSAEAKQISEIEEAKELARLDIMAWVSVRIENKQDTKLRNSDVQGILDGKSYVKEAKETSFTTAKGEHDIPYSEIATISDGTGDVSLDVLIGQPKSNILFKSSIPIDATTNAKFYDCNFATLDDYIEYEDQIYKVIYNIDYEGDYPERTSTVSSVESTDIDISELGVNGTNIVTIVHGTSTYFDERSYETIGGVPSGFVEDYLGARECLFPYSGTGVLTGWYMTGNYDDDYSDYGYIPIYQNPTN